MAMRLQRSKKSRSWSKDRRRKNAGGPRSSSRAPIYAFCCGSVLLTVLWGMLQSFGVPGPWARPLHHDGSYQDRIQGLRNKRDDLQKQNLALDAKLAVRGDKPRTVHPGPDLGVDYRNGGGVVYKPAGVTVETDGHFILGLSDEEFRSTPVDEMMAQYDTHKCDESFGNGLVDRWRNTGRECCSGDIADHSSSIRCHLMRQADHHGTGDNLVQMKNVQVDMSYFRDAGVAKGVMAAYKRSKHSEQAYVHFRKGAVKGTCAPDSQSWKESNFPGWNVDWTTKAFQSVEGLQCDEWVEHPVMVVQRDTFANLFHDSEDFVNTFLAMAILRKSPGDTQVLLTDLYPKGPFWPMWDKVFGAGLPTLTAWEAGQRYGEKKTCFRDLSVGIYGPAAPTTLARMVTSCFHTALVRAYSDFVIRGLGLQGHTRYRSPPSKKVVVTWMARRSSVQWPERAFCSEDGKDSFFTCDYFMHLDKRELQRKVRNEAEVVASLKTLEKKDFENGAEVEVRDVDYNLLSFEDQIKTDLETDVMIGPHGAGLYHIIFTPDRASLIELQIDQTTQRKHFNNLARWSGHGYSSRGGPNPVPADATKLMVEEVIARMNLTKH